MASDYNTAALKYLTLKSNVLKSNQCRVGWVSSFIVNPAFPYECVGLRKDATQPTRLPPLIADSSYCSISEI